IGKLDGVRNDRGLPLSVRAICVPYQASSPLIPGSRSSQRMRNTRLTPSSAASAQVARFSRKDWAAPVSGGSSVFSEVLMVGSRVIVASGNLRSRTEVTLGTVRLSWMRCLRVLDRHLQRGPKCGAPVHARQTAISD